MTSLIWRIHHLFELKRKEARAHYEKEFGVPIDDPSIDDKLEALVRGIEVEGAMVVPAELVLAIVMRPRKGKPSKERWAKRVEGIAVRQASRRWAELGATKTARHQAAVEAWEEHGERAHVGVETIKAKMRLRKSR